jgi:FkbM family methyltransferase
MNRTADVTRDQPDTASPTAPPEPTGPGASARESARRDAVLNPASIEHARAAGWPPRSRGDLASVARLLNRLKILGEQAMKLVYMDARVRALLENLQLRNRRYATTQAWRVVAPNGATVAFPLGSPPAVEFKKLVDESDQLYERPLLDLIARRVGPGDIVVDVGAHVGYVSAIAATTGATVFAIEFQRELIPLIEQVAAQNGLDLLRVLHVGASDRATLSVAMRGHLSPGQKLESGLTRKLLGTEPDSVLNDYVPVMTLDQLFDSEELAPTLVKIDVEGHEIGVLDGAHGLIARRRTTFVVEYHDHLIRSYGRQPADLLAPFGTGWRLSQLNDDGLTPLKTLDDIVPDVRDPNPKLVFDPVDA